MAPASPPSSPDTYGFIGAGAITAAVVEGLNVCGDPPPVLLSPRGRDVGQDLVRRFPAVRVCAGNQDVVDGATSIVVAVRPPLAQAVLEGLSFGRQHTVISVMAGVQLTRLQAWVAPAGRIVRAIPLPAAARAGSLTAIYPDELAARDLFARVGRVLVPDDEGTLDALSAATATFAAHLDYLATIAGWLTDRGLDHAAATHYVTHIFCQLGQALAERPDALTTVTGQYMTPGGINEQVMDDLRRDHVPDSVRRALDRVLTRLRGWRSP